MRPVTILVAGAQAAQNADGEGNGVAGDLTALVKSLADVDQIPAKLHKVCRRSCILSACTASKPWLHLLRVLWHC